jgi:autotransporter translocation and assembly factor TamB
MTGVFSNCRGTLTLADSKLVLSNMKLTDSLSIASASADLPELLRGQLQMEFALNAFSGNIQGELSSGAREEHLIFESSGTFGNISVAQLAAFFGQDADGTIKTGKFSFHGSPRDLGRATFTTRFEAGAFRWGPRRWNSLVAGATYVHRHLENLVFQLTQAGNSLMLNGDMNVPTSWKEWWKTDFSFDVAAKIDDLSELSALLGPDFGDIFGKLTVDGSVRGENASFNGQLIVSGSHLSFRKAPLDELQAAIKLQGNEIQVTNAEFTHGDDFLRGHGVVNILGEKRYWGEVKASIADLALYSSFLQPPIAPEAYGGGLMLDWSGDGAQSAHSGAFTLRLNKLRPLVTGSGDAAWQPIDLDAEATYSPDSIFFSNLVLGNGATTLASRVVATPRSLTLQNIKLQHEKAVWLSGDAQVPLNVWAAWQNPRTASWWNFESPLKLSLKLNRLSVRDTLLLSGRQQPFDGELTGDLNTGGTLAKLTAAGHLVIKNAGGAFPDGTLKGAGGTLDFKGDQLTIASGTGDWNAMPWTASGTVATGDLRTPALDLAVKLPGAPLTLAKGIEATAALDLRATGRPDALALSGSAQLQAVRLDRRAGIESLVSPRGAGLEGPLPALAIPGPPAWKLDVHIGGNAAATLPNSTGGIAPALEITGSLARPVVAGTIAVKGFSIADGSNGLTIADGTYYLNPADPAASALVLRASGVAAGEAFDGYIYGTLARKYFTWDPDVTAALSGHAPAATVTPAAATPAGLLESGTHAAAPPAPAAPATPAPAKP